jgi:hypothetical protein
MAPKLQNREAHLQMYLLIASRVRDQTDLVFALDLYDAIEEARVLLLAEVQKGNTAYAAVIEDIRNKHISRLSELMSSCRN